ncbi:MAG: phosphoribosylanthranilate isomerase, partial [Vulcanimicrobiaceae bacterium]
MLAIDAGADALGFIFAPSERQISVEAAAAIASRLPPFTVIFGVFADPLPHEIRRAQGAIPGLRLQFSGDEPPELCESLANSAYLKAIHLGRPDGDDARWIAGGAEFTRVIPLFDAWHPSKRGGTGIT